MVHPPSVSNRRTHAQMVESGGTTNTSAQSSSGSESGSSTTQAASEVTKRTLLSLVDGEGGPIKKVFSYLNISDAGKLARAFPNKLSNSRYRAEIPYTFAPTRELIPELMPDPQNPTVKPAAWNRVIPGFTRFRPPQGTTGQQVLSLINSGWLNSATHVESKFRLPPGTTDAQLGALIDSGWFNAVTHWDLSGCSQLTDEGLAHLARVTGLERLNLSGCNRITDVGVAKIAQVTGLKYLNLAGCNRITDVGLAKIAQLAGLKYLNLGGCDQLTNAGLAHIANLTGLKSLNLLRCTRIATQGLEALLAQLPNLERLDARIRLPPGITDAQLGALINSGRFNRVTHWNLQGCNQLTNAGLAHMARLPRLESVRVAGCPRITTQGLETLLAQLPNLERLDARIRLLPGTTDAQLGALIDSGRFNRVTYWDLQGCNRLTDAGLAHLARLPSLKHLNVAGCNQLTNAGLAHIANLTGLKSLVLWGCTRITTQGLATLLAQLPNLERLDARFRLPPGITDARLGALIASGRFNRVTYWALQGCNQLTDTGVAHIANLTGLKSLNLLRCTRITNQGLETLLAQLPNLERLDIRGCDLITDALLPRLRASHPNLVVLR